MKEFYVVDDDCLNLFDEMVQEDEVCVIAPLSTMKKIVFWILGEDDDADPAIVMINTDLDERDEVESPYLLCYVPNKEFDLGPFGFSIEGFDGPVYIYDKISSSYLADLDEATAIPFHYQSEDIEEKEIIEKAKETSLDNKMGKKSGLKTTTDENGIIRITDEDGGMNGFTEHICHEDGGYTSYSFYSTDKDLVEAMAERRSQELKTIEDLGKRKG